MTESQEAPPQGAIHETEAPAAESVVAAAEAEAGPGKSPPKKRAWRRTILTGLAFIAGFIALGVIAIQVWEYSNSVGFCSNVCHAVHPEETEAFSDSYHAEVKCTECHMGRLGTLRGIFLKVGHFRHLPEVIFKNYERPLRSATMRPANESCEKCHYPPAFHGDRVDAITSFLSDRQNTEKMTYVILKTGGGKREEGLGYGIHWHIENKVEYIATADDKQEIRWVRSTLPDGRTVEYNDKLNPLTAEEIATSQIRTMDCVDCHNRVGHPFPSPEQLVDQALADGQLSKDLPYAREEMVKLLSATYASQDEAIQGVGQLKAQYAQQYPDVAATYSAEIEQAQTLALELVKRLVFSKAGVTWKSFFDNRGHNDFPGCFRCHDGKHLSAEGESIRLHCNICHSIPATVAAGSRPPEMPPATVQEPAFHLDTNFIADHRFLADQSCAECHGDIHFGNDDSGFCANSACHGRAWPEVDLNAAFQHPIELSGKHAQVLCSECHQGQRKPIYKCSNCHQPPTATHFGDQCEDCHTTAGFDQANLANFQHPVALVGAHASLQCTACHSGGKKLTYKCSECHQPPSQPHFGTECENCHQPTSFEDVTMPPELHPIKLIGAHARATCEVCHAEGARVPEYVCSNCHKPPANHFPQPCDTCHTPEGWVQSAARIVQAAPKIPHPVQDAMADCLTCHGEDKIKPAPANHKDYIKEQCQLCHKVNQ